MSIEFKFKYYVYLFFSFLLNIEKLKVTFRTEDNSDYTKWNKELYILYHHYDHNIKTLIIIWIILFQILKGLQGI